MTINETNPKGENWPRLSQQCTHPPGRDRCQNCGLSASPGVSDQRLRIWQECDDQDRPQSIFVILCGACSEKLIESHPRLYRERLRAEPNPGCLTICDHCRHRCGTSCTCPESRANGGDRIYFYPGPQAVHLCRSPRQLSGWMYLLPEDPKRCSGFESIEGEAPGHG